MGIFKNIFSPKQPERTAFNNSMNVNSWMQPGLKGLMVNNTSNVDIRPEHLYRGYGFGIIRSVVNSGIIAAEENIRTTCSSLQREILAQNDDQIEHPYRTLWRNSPYFSEYEFWKKYLTYIQLNGEFYIYMNRKPLAGSGRYRPGTKNLMTKTAYMKIINPNEMQPKSYNDDGTVKEWLRTFKNPNRTGKDMQQTYQAHEIIRVSELNPWHEEKPFSLLDATKENLFTLENAKDYTRHALVGNVNAPGLLSVDGEFQSQEEFDNYVAMIKHHDEGEMIIAAGNAKATYQDMNQNLDGASQEKIRGIERDEMLVTTGVSKSVLGIETSGLTRDVAATQKLTFTERTVIPYIKLLLETLNFDYRVNYAGDFILDKYILHVTIPSVGDKAQEAKELEIRETEYAMVQRYVDRGYTRKSAAQYVRGEIDVEQLQLEKGDKVRLSPTESVELVDSAERWEALIQAGNDPQSVIDLISGKITMAEFIKQNQDVMVSPSEPISTGDNPTVDPESTGDDDEKKTPTDYYDPDPEDYSTPRDQKDTPADKTRKEKKNAIAIETIMNKKGVTADEAEAILLEGKMDRALRCDIQDNIDKAERDTLDKKEN